MSGNRFLIMLAFLLAVFVFITPADAKKIKGDPELLWLSPLGKSDIENNDYNRCLLIKTAKPGSGRAVETGTKVHAILSTYAANIYAQSIKLAEYIEAEKEKNDEKDPDLSDEKALLDEEVTKRLGDIARRMNIINSFEAGTLLLESLNALNKLPLESYEEFRVFKDGSMIYSSDCNDLR